MHDLQTEREWAERAASGDAASWRRIWEATSQKLFALLVYQIGDREEAKDLLQETYLAAYRRLGQFRGDAPLESWLRRIALRKAIDWKRGWLRKLKRTAVLGDAVDRLEDDKGGDATDSIRFRSEREALHRALDALSQRQRAVLLLREWEQRSFAEIASIVGCNESTARVHHVRARDRMRRLLEESALPFGLEEWEGQRT